jgi:hypothetical protein
VAVASCVAPAGFEILETMPVATETFSPPKAIIV